MAARPSEPAFFPPPPPLLPRGMRPANPTVYTQRQPQPADRFQLAAQQLDPQQLALTHGCGQAPRPKLLHPPPQTAAAAAPSAPPAAPQKPTVLPSSEQSKQLKPQLSESELEKRIDKASIKGNFGWMTLDGVNIPCLFRNDEKYVSVRMVEQKLLSKYPSTYPDELRDRPPLKSQFITSAEAKLLNEINIEHCECEFGQQAFTEKDLIVSWPDFVDFYKIVKKHFPNENVAARQRKPCPVMCGGGGWMQINNTVVPYLKRLTLSAKETLRLAPLPVIKYAAGLLTDTEVPCLEPTEEECQQLSDMCKKAGLDFKFSSANTQLVLLSMIPAYSNSKVVMKKLPDDDPFASAEYCSEIEEEKVNAGGQCGVILPTMQELPAASYGPRPASNGHQFLTKVDNRPPPNVTVQRSTGSVSVAQPNMYTITRVERPPPVMNMSPGQMMSPQHGSSSPALQALEQLSGPPMKRQKAMTSSASAPPMPQSSPSQLNGSRDLLQHSTPVPSPTQPAFPPGMPPFALGQFNAGGSRMIPPPPGMIPAGFNGWLSAPQQHPGDMQKLAEMVSFQAAMLSQVRPVAVSHSSKELTNQMAPRKSTAQPVPVSQYRPVRPVKPAAEEQAVTNKQRRKSVSLLEKIQPIDFHGKKISCLVREDTNQQFALMEAISRVYFPQCSLEEFINAVANVLQISIYQLNREEEKAFITFYGLSTESLKCNKVLNLHELNHFMPRLKFMFRDRDHPAVNGGNSGISGQLQAEAASIHLGLTSNDGTLTSMAPGQDNMNGNLLGHDSAVLPPPNPFRKPGGWPKNRALGKVASKLEDAVNRLRQNKMLELGSSSSPTASSASEMIQNLSVLPHNPFQMKDGVPISSLPSASQSQ